MDSTKRFKEHNKKQKLEELKETALGERFLVAEKTLGLMKEGLLPNLRQLIFSTGVELRTIDDAEKFSATIANGSYDELNRQSTHRAYACSSLTEYGTLQSTIYCLGDGTEGQLSFGEQELITSAAAKTRLACYTAIGLNADSVMDFTPILDPKKED